VHGNPLGLSAEEMRALGYRAVDLLGERVDAASRRVLRSASPAERLLRTISPDVARADGQAAAYERPPP
jgi:hypothetical protein